MSEAQEPEAVQLQPDDITLGLERRFAVGDREIVIKPLVIGEFKRVQGDIGQICQRIAVEHPEIDLQNPEQHLAVIVPIVGDVIGRLLERLTGVEEAYLDKHLTAVMVSRIVVALLEVNEVPEILKNGQRARQILRGGTLAPMPL